VLPKINHRVFIQLLILYVVFLDSNNKYHYEKPVLNDKHRRDGRKKTWEAMASNVCD